MALLALLANLAWHAASDLYAPASKTGSVAAFTSQITPRVSGQVVEIFVQDNQRVSAGAPLFALDREPFDLAVRQADVALAQATRAVGASTASLAGAEAQVEQARAALANTEASAFRTRNLLERGFTTRAQAEAAES